MPYKVEKRGEQWCCVKADGGKSMGCHGTKGEAEAQMAAIYANEGKSIFDSVKDRVKSFIDSILFEETIGEIDAKEKNINSRVFMLWKEQGGRHRFLCTYSNHFRDSDFPPEIISSDAHKEFIARVDKGEDPYPELWHWHIPGTMWGKADWLCFTDEGFALASGYILPGHEKEAELLSGITGIRTSHGMPRTSIRYAADDKSVLTRYSSIEISDLPAKAAANMLTDFMVLEVENMIPQPKKDYLKQVGLTDETINGIERNLEDKAKAADTLGLEHKEVEPEVQKETPEVVEPVSEKADFASRSDITALVDAITAAAESIKSVKDAQAEMLAAIVTLQTAEKERKEQTPTPSSNLTFLKGLFNYSPVGNEKAAVAGNSEATRGPKENKSAAPSLTGIPLIDRFTARSNGDGEQ